MTERLTIDRFRALAEAYGGVIGRWPEGQRAAASRLATTSEAAAILADALALDVALDAWRVSAPEASLTDRVLASSRGSGLHFRPSVRLWWSGVGIAATLAGAVAGTASVAMVAPIDGSSGVSTSFGDVAGQDS